MGAGASECYLFGARRHAAIEHREVDRSIARFEAERRKLDVAVERNEAKLTKDHPSRAGGTQQLIGDGPSHGLVSTAIERGEVPCPTLPAWVVGQLIETARNPQRACAHRDAGSQSQDRAANGHLERTSRERQSSAGDNGNGAPRVRARSSPTPPPSRSPPMIEVVGLDHRSRPRLGRRGERSASRPPARASPIVSHDPARREQPGRSGTNSSTRGVSTTASVPAISEVGSNRSIASSDRPRLVTPSAEGGVVATGHCRNSTAGTTARIPISTAMAASTHRTVRYGEIARVTRSPISAGVLDGDQLDRCVGRRPVPDE